MLNWCFGQWFLCFAQYLRMPFSRFAVFRIDRSSMIHNVRMSVRMSVRMFGTYNLPNRNRYEKTVITKKLRFDKNRCKWSHLSAYRKLLAKKHVFFKSKPLKIWNFGKNEKVSFWCDDLKKSRRIQKNKHFFDLRKIINRKTSFFKFKIVEDMKFW